MPNIKRFRLLNKWLLQINYYIEGAKKYNDSRWKVIDHFEGSIEKADKLGWNNGEMWISFRLNNINYYLEDGVPYGDTVKFQKAVRIGD